MSTTVNELLRGIVDRHGRALLQQPRRCEACLVDARLGPREVAALMAALSAGIPARLAAASTTTTGAIRDLAAAGHLGVGTAQRAVEAWAYGLRLGPSAGAPVLPPARTRLEAEPAEPTERRRTVGDYARLALFVGISVALPVAFLMLAGNSLSLWHLFAGFALWAKSVQEVMRFFSREPAR